MEKIKGLTMSVITECESLNYGEGIGNTTVLKKISREGGKSYSYLSRQGLAYEIKKQMGIDITDLILDGSVIQFAPDANIRDFAEIDLFGYMKTIKPTKTRNAVARVSHVTSLESYNSDVDFLTNINMLERYNKTSQEQKSGGNISQSEIHKSYYSYTICIDLDKVGIDVNDGIEISNEEKAKRVKALLKVLKFLYRDIKGRRENLNPILAIGGVYSVKNPFFQNRLKLKDGNGVNLTPLKQTLGLDAEVQENTRVGLIEGIFSNDKEIKDELNAIEMKDFFDYLDKQVDAFYEV